MSLLSRQELIDARYPFGKAEEGIPMGSQQNEISRTNPDIVLFKPKNEFGYDTGNEHLLVFEAPNRKELLALWLQHTKEGFGDEHVVLARSNDGVNWSEPVELLGAGDGETKAAKWAFPLISKSGRIYLIYFREHLQKSSTTMAAIYSDDAGHTWSKPEDIPLKSTCWDNPGETANWVVWQIPIRDHKDRYIIGVTISTGDKVKSPGPIWTLNDTHGVLMRFNNIDENPEPKDILYEWLPENTLSVTNPARPDVSAAQEPAIVKLPDNRLFIVMRTMTGHPYYCVADPDCETFTTPKPIACEDGSLLLHPLSPCPIYELKDGRYLLLIHNNNGVRGIFDQSATNWTSNWANFFRNPTYYCIGRYTPDAEQPITFSSPVKIFDTDDVAVGPKRTAETATYTSMTHFQGERILWYPDRKFYLLGKRLPDTMLNI